MHISSNVFGLNIEPSGNIILQSIKNKTTDIGMSTRHLGTRAGEHLNLDDSHKSAIRIIYDHVINVTMGTKMLLQDSAIQIMIQKKNMKLY